MALAIKHFDTLTRQDLDIQENIQNSLAEYLFPDTKFAIGSIYQEITTPEHLDTYQDKTLQFSSGERMYFGNEEIRELAYPNLSDGSTYGSLVFTPCQSFEEINAKVLIVEHETGANGGLLPTDMAKELVADCWGKISEEMAEKLTGVTNTPFQFRLGIKPQAESSVYRIAKGTFAPSNKLGELTGSQVVDKAGYDLIIPTSSFKGRKEGYEPIEPGEYNLKVGIGIKTLAKYGEQSLGTQVLVNYPKAVQTEILPELEDEDKKLAANQSSPQKLAQQYIELYERRKELIQDGQSLDKDFNYEDLEGFDEIIDEAFGDEDNTQNTAEQDWALYRLLKADKHAKLTEHPKIIDELNKFVRKRWVEIATGRAIKFKSGMAQPSLRLKKDEICVPIIPHGKEVIVTRSPLINSNGVIVLKNRHLPEVKHLQGVVHIHPDTAAERLQGDFDGDVLAFEKAEKYPVLAAEVKEYNLEQNRYPDIVKRDKIPYQGTFPEIALSAADNKIGLIANQIQRAVALRWETYALPESNKVGYVKNIAQKMSSLVEESEAGSIPEKYQERVDFLASLSPQPPLEQASPKQLSPEEINKALETVRSINFDLVADLGNELQVAVDGPKSAARPDEEQLRNLKAIGGYKYPKWLYEKKNPQAYLDRPMKTNGYSPIDLMINQTNKSFQSNQLTPLTTVSFRPLFSDVKFTPQQEQLARSIRDTYNSLLGRAILASQRSDKPILKVTSATSGKTIEVSKILKPGNAQIWRAEKLDIGIREHFKSTPENKNTRLLSEVREKGKGEREKEYINNLSPFPLNLSPKQDRGLSDKTKSCPLNAVVIQEDGIEKSIGVITAEQIKEHGLKPGHTLRGAKVSVEPGVTKAQVKAMFKEATDYLDYFRQKTPEQDKTALAAALWHVSHTKGSDRGNHYKKASVALNLFPEEVIKQLEKPPVRDMQIGGIAFSSYADKIWQGEKVNCEVQKVEDKNSPNYGKKMVLVEGKPLGHFVRDSTSLPNQTKFTANLSSPLGAYVMATTPKGNEIKIGQIKNFAFKDNQWKDKPANLKLGYEWIKNKKEPVALLEGKILGIVHRDSVKDLKNVKGQNLIEQGYSPQVTLTRSPSTIVDLKLDVDSLVYPWTSQSEIKQAEPVPLQSNSPEPKFISSEAVSVVSPILKDFLKLKQVEHFQGENYSATWKKDNQTLTLSDSSGSTKLEAQYVGGEWQAKVDNLTPQDVKFFQKLQPKIQEKLNPNPSIEEKRQLLRQEYERLRGQVKSNPHLSGAGVEKTDLAIARLVIQEAYASGQKDNLLNRVGLALSQSDRLKEWKQSLPESEYRTLAKEYVFQKFEQASQIRESILAEKQDTFDLAR